MFARFGEMFARFGELSRVKVCAICVQNAKIQTENLLIVCGD